MSEESNSEEEEEETEPPSSEEALVKEVEAEVTNSKAKKRKAPVAEVPGSQNIASKKPAPASFEDIYEHNALDDSDEESDEESDEKSDEEEVISGNQVPQLYVPGLLETVLQKFQSRTSTPVVSESGDGSGLGEGTSNQVNLIPMPSWQLKFIIIYHNLSSKFIIISCKGWHGGRLCPPDLSVNQTGTRGAYCRQEAAIPAIRVSEGGGVDPCWWA